MEFCAAQRTSEYFHASDVIDESTRRGHPGRNANGGFESVKGKSFAELEREILLSLETSAGMSPEPATIFIVGAPRTGSTFFFQSIIAGFRLPYFSNLINDFFPEHPLLGLCVQRGYPGAESVRFSSSYGKTEGLLQPSEGSAVMRNWCGGGHPSQTVSSAVLPGRELHMRLTLGACERLAGGPVVIKNAWNSFRIDSLSAVLPGARFIWIRRDIRAAASSDLAARYTVQGSPWIWNSATPANVEALRQRPYSEQVVENQFEFSLAIQASLEKLPATRWTSIWYEDLCNDPAQIIQTFDRSSIYLGEPALRAIKSITTQSRIDSGLNAGDQQAVSDFVDSSKKRFADAIYRARSMSFTR